MGLHFFSGFDHFRAANFYKFPFDYAAGVDQNSLKTGRYTGGGSAWGIFNTGFGEAVYGYPVNFSQLYVHMDLNFGDPLGNYTFWRADSTDPRFPGVTSLVLLSYTSTGRLELRVNATGAGNNVGTLIYQSAASFIVPGTWYNVELVFGASAFQLWVDNTLLHQVAGSFGLIGWATQRWQNLGLNQGVWYDNYILVNMATAGLNSRQGYLAVETVFPSANYSVQWLSAGVLIGVPNWQAHDSADSAGGWPDGDLQYVQGTFGQYDVYEFTDFTRSVATIYGAAVTGYMRDTNGGVAALVNGKLNQLGAMGENGSYGLTSADYRFGKAIYDNNPYTGLPWNHALLNATRFGMVVASPGATVRFSQLALERVVKAPGAGTGDTGALYKVTE